MDKSVGVRFQLSASVIDLLTCAAIDTTPVLPGMRRRLVADIALLIIKGGEGGIELAKRVCEVCENTEIEKLCHPYELDEGVCEKIENVAKKIYGADGVDFSEEALAKIKTIEEKGCGNSIAFKGEAYCIYSAVSSNRRIIGEAIEYPTIYISTKR